MAKCESEELLQFLQPEARSDLKSLALQHLLGMTGTQEGKEFFIDNAKFLDALIMLSRDEANPIKKQSYTALINLTTDNITISHICTNKRFIEELMLNILDRNFTMVDEACMLLSNLTRTHEHAVVVASLIEKHNANRNILKEFTTLLRTSLNSSSPNCTYDYISYVLSNLSQIKNISIQLVSEGLLEVLLVFLDSKKSLIRNRGAIGVVRNCCMFTENHEKLLCTNLDILPYLLLPLAGPEEFDDEDTEKLPTDLQYLEPNKTREPDSTIRRMLVESLTQLCTTSYGRCYIRSKNAYVILRELHKWETNRENKQAIEDVVQFLIGDEPSSTLEKDAQTPALHIEDEIN